MIMVTPFLFFDLNKNKITRAYAVYENVTFLFYLNLNFINVNGGVANG